MDKKRITARGIIIEDQEVYLMFRRKVLEDGSVKEYYVIPGGGIEEGETPEMAVIRELKEEFSVDTEIIKYLGTNEEADTYFFECRILNESPKLSGEELERFHENNYYEIKKMSIHTLDNLDLLYKDIILKAYYANYK